MTERRAYTEAEIEAAVERLMEPGRLETAQRVVSHSAAQLQRVLNEALEQGGWFSSDHQASVRKAASNQDPQERELAVRTLVADETRLSMLVGVAVGLELGHLLIDTTDDTPPTGAA